MLRTISNNFTTHTRYLYQAQEMDNEIKGEGNSVNYKYRMHDPRLGRFFAVDPMFKDFPSNSSYAFSENNVIHAVELEGLEKVHVYNKWMDSKGDMQSKYSHTYIDKRLKENINQVNSYNAKGDIASKTYKSKNTSVKIKAGTEYKNDFTQFFDSEKSGFTSIDTRSMPDAMRHDSWEGGDDGANAGGQFGGNRGWDNGGKQLLYGTIGLVTSPLTFGAAAGWLGYSSATIGTLNNIDDVAGVALPKTNGYQSLTQYLSNSQGTKNNISKVKGILNYSNFISGGANTLNGLTKPTTLNGVSGGVNTMIEGLQIKGSTKELKK